MFARRRNVPTVGGGSGGAGRGGAGRGGCGGRGGGGAGLGGSGGTGRAEKARSVAIGKPVELPSDSADDDEDDDDSEAQRMGVILTVWHVGRVQKMNALAEQYKTSINDSKNRPTFEKIKNMLGTMPLEALEAAGLGSVAKDISSKSRLGKKQTETVLNAVLEFTNKVITFQEGQGGNTGASGGGTATPIAGEVEKKNSDCKGDEEEPKKDN